MKTHSNNFDVHPLAKGRTRATAHAGSRLAAVMTALLLCSGAQAAEATGITTSYDWSVLIAAGFGLLGLIWIRRHVSRL